MEFRPRAALAALALVLTCLSSSAWCGAEVGLDIGRPIDPGTGKAGANTDPAIAADLGTAWVRVNFVRGPWPDIESSFPVYDAIVDGFRARGISVYMLLGAEAYEYPGDILRDEDSSDPDRAEEWVRGFTETCVGIVDHFKDRVRVYEIYNEPNNWDGGQNAVVHPRWFARILQDVYLEVKSFSGHADQPAWQVTIVSGPLFSFDGTTAADYAADMYWYGTNTLAWDWTRAQTGSYPLDGFGYHLYVAQESTDVAAALDHNLSACWDVVTDYEGAGTAKRIWVSEFGWLSDVLGEDGQAEALRAAFAHFKDDDRVAAAFWFTLEDFPLPHGMETWGLHHLGDLSKRERKAAYRAFQEAAGAATAVSPPPAPVALSPGGWAQVQGTPVTFAWRLPDGEQADAFGVSVYRLAVSAAGLRWHRVARGRTAATSAAIRLPRGTYAWRVLAWRRQGGRSPWSNVFGFRVR